MKNIIILVILKSDSLMGYNDFSMIIKVLKSYKYAMIYNKQYCK